MTLERQITRSIARGGPCQPLLWRNRLYGQWLVIPVGRAGFRRLAVQVQGYWRIRDNNEPLPWGLMDIDQRQVTAAEQEHLSCWGRQIASQYAGLSTIESDGVVPPRYVATLLNGSKIMASCEPMTYTPFRGIRVRQWAMPKLTLDCYAASWYERAKQYFRQIARQVKQQ